jgi:hypothetical protein
VPNRGKKAIQDKMHTALEFFIQTERMEQKVARGPIIQIAKQCGNEVIHQQYAARQ